MARIWIDVEDASGNKLGDGPITTASEWQYRPTLDGAGTFSFTMPAGDPRAALLSNKRIAHAWMEEAGTITDVGAGVIDEIDLQAGEPTMLRVRGPDLLAELGARVIPSLTVCEQALVDLDIDDDLGVYRGAVRWLRDNYGVTSDEDLPDAHDGVTDTGGETIRLWREATVFADWLYVGYDARFDFARVTLSGEYLETNRRESTLIGQYFDGSQWVDLPDLVDGTRGWVDFASHWATMNQSGDITWTRPADWARVEPTAAAGSWFWVRFTVESGTVTDDFVLREVQVYADVPTDDGVNIIMAYAPDTWTQDGYPATVAAKYLELTGESVLAALRALAEQGGQGVDDPREHFRLGTGRAIDWFSAFTDSGLRAENALTPGDDVCLICELRERRDTAELVTRLYPVSNDGIPLSLTTRTAPSGYTMDTTNGYIEKDSAVTALGQIDAFLRFTDITSQQEDSWWLHPAMVSNAVYDRGIEYLRTHCEVQRFYSLTLAHVRGALVPGNTLHVVYHEYQDGYHAAAIDGVLYVLGTAVQVDESGLHTVGAEVATVDRVSQSDAGVIVETIEDVRRLGTANAGVWSIFGAGGAGSRGDRTYEGPGIDVVEDGYSKTIGLGGDAVLLYDSGGLPVVEYATITAACAAAASGDMVQPQAGTYTENITIPAGVTVRGRGPATVIAGTVTGASGATLQGVYVRVVGDSPDPLYGVKGAGDKFRVLDCFVYVENATGPARAVAAVSGGETRCQNVRVAAVGGEEGYGFYQDVGDLYTDHCIARASDCTTAPLRRRG